MFDLATLPQSAYGSSAAVLGTPFDLRLGPAQAPAYLHYTDYVNATGTAQPGVELLASYCLALEDTLNTAVIISLFTDRRAGRDDVLPLHQADRRGWVGDDFMRSQNDPQVDAWGSHLWLYYSGKASDNVLERARFAAQEALAWMVRDGIAQRIDVATQWVGERRDRLAVRPTIYKPAQVQPVYDVLWGTSIARGLQ